MPSNHLILCCPLLLLPSIFPSIRVFPKESVPHIRWPNYWNFSFNICPSDEYSGLISIEIDWFCLLAVQGILQGKNHSFDYTDFVDNVMFLLFNMLSAAAAAKSLQSCSTLCDPIDSSPPGSSTHGIFQATVLEWGAIAFSKPYMTYW